MRRAAWLGAAMLACCSGPPPAPAPAAVAPGPALCRVGPDGGRPMADRGIGGTGAPATRTADRGIGGTGIIGVVTGFASVCVAGEEVALPPGTPTRLDADPAQLDDLRAGQVIAMEAAGPQGALRATRIVVRHLVVGPVEAVDPHGMTVAGQSVALDGATGSAVAARPGQWVAVSGFREGGGTIAATRVDPAPPGPVLVRGELQRIYGDNRIGGLAVTLPDGFDPPAGWPVTVEGHLAKGVLVADTAELDLASQSPSAYFGPAVSHFVIETDVALLAGGYLVASDFVAGHGFGAAGTRGRGVARFERGPAGLVATGLQLRDGAGMAGAAGFSPAPVPGGGGLPGAGGGRGGASPFGTGGGQGGFGGAAGQSGFGQGGSGPVPSGPGRGGGGPGRH